MDLNQIWENNFELFVRRAKRFGLGTSAAEDVIQDLAIEAIKRKSKFQDGEHFRHWALRVIRHRAIDYLAKNLPVPLGNASEQLPATESPPVWDSELTEFIRGAIEKLPSRQRELIERIQAGQSTSEIAKEMQIATASARSLKRHAMNFIRVHCEHFFEERRQ